MTIFRTSRWFKILWCKLKRHEITVCCQGAHKWCVTCLNRKLDENYDPKAYKVGDHLWYNYVDGIYEEVIVERINRPTTLGSKAWLMTRLVSVDPAASGGRIGAPDNFFSRTGEVK